jgi:hypothetical protein
MAHDWQDLTALTGAKEFSVTAVRLKQTGIVVEGEFDLPPLARLTYEDQVFVAMFVRTHGTIKEMEPIFGVSYPTIKSRLNRIAQQLEFVRVTQTTDREDVLAKLERGEISAKEATERLKQ